MPIYEFECQVCKKKLELYLKVDECGQNLYCPECVQVKLTKIISKPIVRSFKPQTLDIIDDNEKPMHASNKQELTDAINRYNDSKWANKSGKVAVLE
jgi:putative FmdB family regulatory protein